MAYINFKDLILFEDDNLIAVNKPAKLPSLHDRNMESVSLIELAKKYHPEAQLCHRLDKETTGILLIAKNPETYRHISMQFENRKISKIYHAVVDGVVSFRDLKVDLPIKSDPKKPFVKIDRYEGKDAETVFNTLTHFTKHTLVECKPLTGRMHQIRVHLSTQNAPITCDQLYGGKLLYLSNIKRGFKLKKGEEEQPAMQRMALHARSLEFTDINGEQMKLEAPYPKDFAVLLKLLDKYKHG